MASRGLKYSSNVMEIVREIREEEDKERQERERLEHPEDYDNKFDPNLLLEKMAHRKLRDPRAKLHLAASKGDLTVVKEVLLNPSLTKEMRRVMLEHRDSYSYNRTVLMQACRNSRLDVVKFLVQEMKADIMARDSFELGSTAVHFAAEWGCFDVVHFLTDYNPDLVELEDRNGASPLNLAAFNGHMKVVEFLVEEKRAKLENTGCLGRTPLLSAAEQGHLDVVTYLATRCANIMAKSNAEGNEDMAIHLAANFGHLKVVDFLTTFKPQLTEAKNATNQTALNIAAIHGQVRIVEFLVDVKKANIEHAGEFGRTPLLQAAEHNHLTIVKFLLSRGADLTAKDSENGDTVLHLAAAFNQTKVVNYFLNMHDIYMILDRNNQGLTPLKLARRLDCSAVINLFQSRGIK